MIVVYTGVTSFILAITGFQITSPETGGEDKIRYTMLIIGWALLFYWICYYGQQIQDEVKPHILYTALIWFYRRLAKLQTPFTTVNGTKTPTLWYWYDVISS